MSAPAAGAPVQVQVQFLGSRDAFGSGGRLQTCLLLSGAGESLLLDYRALREHRRRLGCRRLILTHMSRDMLDRLGEVDAACAEDGLVVSV